MKEDNILSIGKLREKKSSGELELSGDSTDIMSEFLEK